MTKEEAERVDHSARKVLQESQVQIDDDGRMIGVSRQALAETLGAYDTMVSLISRQERELALCQGLLREEKEQYVASHESHMNTAHDLACCIEVGNKDRAEIARLKDMLEKRGGSGKSGH